MPWSGADEYKGDLSAWSGGEFPPDVGLQAKIISGGSAGDHTVSGVRENDDLMAVFYHAPAGPALTDITSEFEGTGKGIVADDTINNTGGTDTSGGTLVVLWAARNEPVA